MKSHLLISGVPGAGKTRFCQWPARDHGCPFRGRQEPRIESEQINNWQTTSARTPPRRRNYCNDTDPADLVSPASILPKNSR